MTRHKPNLLARIFCAVAVVKRLACKQPVFFVSPLGGVKPTSYSRAIWKIILGDFLP
jgi:hypothetical protein